MVERTVRFSERFFFLMVWVILALVVAGVVIHYAESKGVLPGFLQKGLAYTNLSSQAGV